MIEYDLELIDEYNSYISEFNDSISDFLHFHYFTDKDNTPFWKNYMNETEVSEKTKRKLKMWKKRIPNVFDKRDGAEKFDTLSWMVVGLGINDNLIPLDVFKKTNSIYNLDTDMKEWMENYLHNLDLAMEKSVDHKLLLKSIVQNAK